MARALLNAAALEAFLENRDVKRIGAAILSAAICKEIWSEGKTRSCCGRDDGLKVIDCVWCPESRTVKYGVDLGSGDRFTLEPPPDSVRTGKPIRRRLGSSRA